MALGAFINGFPEIIVSSQEGSFAFLTVFNVICGIGLIAGYALLGACWLILKADGRLRERCFALAFTLGIVLAAYLAMISIWTPLAHPRVAERWFSFPNFLFLALPIPLAAALCWVNMMRSLALRREAAPFLSAIAIFVLSFTGLGISVWPADRFRIIPRSSTMPPRREIARFSLIGVIALLPLILGYTAHSYWVFRGKVTDADGYH